MTIKDLKIYAKNAKEHPINQIVKIADSIKRFGFNQPIIVDKNNVVIVGHGRLAAAKQLGLKKVQMGVSRAEKGADYIPVIVIDDLSEAEIKAYRLADNRLNESLWMMDIVSEELKDLDDELINLTGFDNELKDIDFSPEKDTEERLDKLSDNNNVECPKCKYKFHFENSPV